MLIAPDAATGDPPAVATTRLPLLDGAAGSVCFLPIRQLRTSYASLRPGGGRSSTDDLAAMPLRVVPIADDTYEVIDGFRRLSRWREEGHRFVPVVVERPESPAQRKRILLAANAPPRTSTALDEARVVCSLIADDHYTPTRVARLLGHKHDWVKSRIAAAPERRARRSGQAVRPITRREVERARMQVSALREGPRGARRLRLEGHGER